MNDICCVVVQKQMKETEASTFVVRLLEYTRVRWGLFIYFEFSIIFQFEFIYCSARAMRLIYLFWV